MPPIFNYCEPTLQLVDPDTGECRSAQVFVAVLGASNYTYAEATLSQRLEDWIMSHVRCFEFQVVCLTCSFLII